MSEIECTVCGDAVPQCDVFILDGECTGCFDGEHDSGICNCCYGVICSKHTASVSCPHQPSDHEATTSSEGGR